jgi:hypothetical protein
MSQIVGRGKKYDGIAGQTGGQPNSATAAQSQNHLRACVEPIDHLENGGASVVEYIGAMAQRVDEVGAPALTYAAEALPGTTNSASKWRIRRITIGGSITVIEWATIPASGGNPARVATFEHDWDNRASHTYT